ncbi:MAG: ATP-binding protein, partial [Acidobacteriota bacterium]
MESGRPAEYVEPVTHPDGLHSWLVHKFPIIERDKVSMVCGIGIDITERAILQEQLGQARKMEALGRLAGGVAHDFNNLLTVIAGYSQLAIESIGTVPDDRLITYMREILDASRRASALTSQLLAFSRRQTVQPKVLNLSDLLLRMYRLLQRVIGEHVEVTVKCTCDECHVHADASQMEQAIMNLAVNARDAMPLGGQLSVRCERLGHPIPQEDGDPLSILLEVRDNGIGMEEAVRSRIFDPFYTSKESGKGTGLGLSTVYGVVTQAKGRIDVESAPGEGTTFKLYFPEAALVAEGLTAVRPSGAAGGHETVLLVEDESAVRMLAETILKRLGYKVLVAESGLAAVRLWEEASGAVDILLTDVIMPHMSGGELAHHLRKKNPHVRVLFMSGYTDDMIASHGVLSGDTQLIQKPFTADALGRKLRAVLDA